MQLIRLEYADAKTHANRREACPALEKVNAGPYCNNVHARYMGGIAANLLDSTYETPTQPGWYSDRLLSTPEYPSPEHVFGFMTKDQFLAWFDVEEKLREFAADLRVAVYEGPKEVFHHGRKQSIADVNHLTLEKVLAIEEFLE